MRLKGTVTLGLHLGTAWLVRSAQSLLTLNELTDILRDLGSPNSTVAAKRGEGWL